MVLNSILRNETYALVQYTQCDTYTARQIIKKQNKSEYVHRVCMCECVCFIFRLLQSILLFMFTINDKKKMIKSSFFAVIILLNDLKHKTEQREN